ncbi:hypothetical protein LTR27_008179 [Elasticomyces elasticus]|nr:hypothetical protein LTR27_008179 [Elasticomyces elasticus]
MFLLRHHDQAEPALAKLARTLPLMRNFKVAALSKGVWDVFSGVFAEAECPDPADYDLHNADANARGKGAATALASDPTDPIKKKTRTTLGPDDIAKLVAAQAQASDNHSKGIDFSGRITLYKFALDEYDKSRKVIATAMALLITWVHPSLRGQLEHWVSPKPAYEHLVARYSITDARAREMADAKFNSIFMLSFRNAQDYINAIENAQSDVLEAGGYCDEPMMISKTIGGLKDHPVYNEFATLYYMLRGMDAKFEVLDHVITELLTFESNNQTKINNFG